MNPKRDLLQIGEAAEHVGLSLRTVRYWEEIGLVTPSARTEGGFRLYSDEDLRRLRIVKHMKPLGLTLEEMRELLELIEQSARPELVDAPELHIVRSKLQEYADRGDEQIAKLERYLDQARSLRRDIADRLGRCDAVLGEAVETRNRR